MPRVSRNRGMNLSRGRLNSEINSKLKHPSFINRRLNQSIFPQMRHVHLEQEKTLCLALELKS